MIRKPLTLLAALPLAALAFDDNGSYFEHKDWEIACDNTGRRSPVSSCATPARMLP